MTQIVQRASEAKHSQCFGVEVRTHGFAHMIKFSSLQVLKKFQVVFKYSINESFTAEQLERSDFPRF